MTRLILCAIISLWTATAIAQPPPVYDFCPLVEVVDLSADEFSTHFGDTCDGEGIVYGTTFTCLDNSDDEGPGGTEEVAYHNETDSPTTYYLVIDSNETSGCGTYRLDLFSHGPVSTEESSWSVLKAIYQ